MHHSHIWCVRADSSGTTSLKAARAANMPPTPGVQMNSFLKAVAEVMIYRMDECLARMFTYSFRTKPSVARRLSAA